MKKKILGVVGSPRRNGNTHILVARLIEGARDAGASADLVFLGDLHIAECDGCHACMEGRPCPKNDDMNALYHKIALSDVIVFGTPVYWYGPTALMKAFVDRFVFFNAPANRPLIAGKTGAAVIPLEENNPDTWAPVVDFFARSLGYLEMRFDGALVAPGVSGKGDVRKRPDLLAEAYERGRRLAEK